RARGIASVRPELEDTPAIMKIAAQGRLSDLPFLALAVYQAYPTRLVVEPADVVVEVPAATPQAVEREPGVGIADPVAVEPPVRGIELRLEHIVAHEGELVVVDHDVGIELAEPGRPLRHPQPPGTGNVHAHGVEAIVDLVVPDDDPAGNVERREERPGLCLQLAVLVFAPVVIVPHDPEGILDPGILLQEEVVRFRARG